MSIVPREMSVLKQWENQGKGKKGNGNLRELVSEQLTSFQPKVTCSPPDKPDPEKSRVKIVIFDGSNIIAASLASALHPLQK